MEGNDGRKEALDNLNKVITEASTILLTLKKINNGTYNEDQGPIQFDYCTSDELARKVSSLENITEQISDIVFQRKRRRK
jgi:hypothetical protein